MKLYILAMSFDRQTLINKLYDISNELTQHLIKLYLFPSSPDINHWKQEVWSFLHDMPKLSSTKKLPKQKLIYSGVSGFLDEIPELAEYIKSEYSSYQVERDDLDELYTIADNYCKWISNQLSHKVILKSSEVYDKLKELGL